MKDTPLFLLTYQDGFEDDYPAAVFQRLVSRFSLRVGFGRVTLTDSHSGIHQVYGVKCDGRLESTKLIKSWGQAGSHKLYLWEFDSTNINRYTCICCPCHSVDELAFAAQAVHRQVLVVNLVSSKLYHEDAVLTKQIEEFRKCDETQEFSTILDSIGTSFGEPEKFYTRNLCGIQTFEIADGQRDLDSTCEEVAKYINTYAPWVFNFTVQSELLNAGFASLSAVDRAIRSYNERNNAKLPRRRVLVVTYLGSFSLFDPACAYSTLVEQYGLRPCHLVLGASDRSKVPEHLLGSDDEFYTYEELMAGTVRVDYRGVGILQNGTYMLGVRNEDLLGCDVVFAPPSMLESVCTALRAMGLRFWMYCFVQSDTDKLLANRELSRLHGMYTGGADGAERAEVLNKLQTARILATRLLGQYENREYVERIYTKSIIKVQETLAAAFKSEDAMYDAVVEGVVTDICSRCYELIASSPASVCKLGLLPGDISA